MKGIFFLLAFSSFVLESFASSPQVPDYIVFENDTTETYNLLVEQYLQSKKSDYGRLFDLSFRNSIDGTPGTSFNCWRGYQAIYKIENDSLFVSAIIKCFSLEKKGETPQNYIQELFGENVKNGKVFIDWYSGVINYPLKSKENQILRWDGVFERLFMHEKNIKIDNGIIIEVSNQENYIKLENGIERLIRDSVSTVLFDQVKDYAWTKLDEYDCSEVYAVLIGKNGRIHDVQMADYDTEELVDTYWDVDEYNHCIKSIKKALSKLQFDILKQRGVPIEEYIYLEIWFNEDGTIENWTH